MIHLAAIIPDGVYRNRMLEYCTERRSVEMIAFESAESFCQAMTHAELPDVILYDIDAENGQSISSLKSITSKFESSPTLVYSSHDDATTIFQSLTAGARGYLLKSEAPSFIYECIESCYDGDAPMSPDVARIITGFFNRRKKTERDPSLEERMTLLRLLAEDRAKEEADTND